MELARPPLEMKFAAGTVKHFGLQMYSTAVPAIAEMVSNAWDADAPDATIGIPFGAPITADLEISVSDNGVGMSYEDCNDRYLVVGRDRRLADGSDQSPGGRRVMGHKGLGKFAPFGIADVVGVRTVRDGRLTHFEMDFRQMVPPPDQPEQQFVQSYRPTIISADVEADERSGTTILMRELRLRRAISQEQFRMAMARRFTAIQPGYFSVHINDTDLPPFSLPLEFRIPDDGEVREVVDGHEVRWWVGFTPAPLTNDELRGVSVVVREKLAQTPFIFQLSKGITGQAGLQYLTGVVKADYLDDEADLISTDRASILWEHPAAEPLLAWGQRQVVRWVAEWATRRAALRLARLRAERPRLAEILDSVAQYPPDERDQLRRLVERLATIINSDDELEWAVLSLEGAFRDRRFVRFIRHLAELDDAPLAEIMTFLHEYEVLESIRLAQVAAARIGVLRTFRQLIDDEVREKPDMQEFVKKNPWLLDPAWQVLRHERAIDTIVVGLLGIEPVGDRRDDRRLDFFCLADSLRVVVVELKRPGYTATLEEWQRFETYVFQLRRYYGRLANEEDRRIVSGLFVATTVEELARGSVEAGEANGLKYTDWSALLRRAERMYREYLDALTAEVPNGDPRLRGIRQTLLEEPLDEEPNAETPVMIETVE